MLAWGPAYADDPDFLAVSLGGHDYDDNEEALEVRLEYRSDRRLWIFKPFSGLMLTSESAAYGYGGVLFDVFFGRRIVLTPSFAAGFYHDGAGKDLGHPCRVSLADRERLPVRWSRTARRRPEPHLERRTGRPQPGDQHADGDLRGSLLDLAWALRRASRAVH